MALHAQLAEISKNASNRHFFIGFNATLTLIAVSLAIIESFNDIDDDTKTSIRWAQEAFTFISITCDYTLLYAYSINDLLRARGSKYQNYDQNDSFFQYWIQYTDWRGILTDITGVTLSFALAGASIFSMSATTSNISKVDFANRPSTDALSIW